MAGRWRRALAAESAFVSHGDIFKLRGALERVDQRGQPRRTVGSGSLSSGIGMLVTLAHGSILRLLFVLKPTPGSLVGFRHCRACQRLALL